MVKPDSCQGCILATFSDGYAVSEGKGTSGVVILGEALGYNEYVDGLPFRPRAQAGSKLDQVIRLVEQETMQPLSRNSFLLYNLVNCHPPGDALAGEKYEAGAVAGCAPNVERVVGGFQTPFNKTVLALGNLPLKYLTGVSGDAKEKQSITNLRGYVLESKYGPVVPGLHPAFIRRGKNHWTPLLMADMRLALEVASGKYTRYLGHPRYVRPQFQVAPNVDEAWGYYYKLKDGSKLVVGYDIETVDTPGSEEDERNELESTEITQVQFSVAKDEGIALPWQGEYIKVISLILGLPNVKLSWNGWNFDAPILESKGVTIGGQDLDLMWMWKHYQPKLPRGLQSVASLFRFPFPWKHLYQADLGFYGCADVSALHYICGPLPGLMKDRGVWEGYKRHILGLHPILVRASKKGIPVSEEKRLALEERFKARRGELDKELQKAIPDELRNIKPKRKDKETGEISYGYISGEPRIVRQGTEEYRRMLGVIPKGRSAIPINVYLERKYNLVYAEFKETDSNEVINRWCIIEPFKASKDQLVKYLKWKKAEVEKVVEDLVLQRQMLGGRDKEITEEIETYRDLAKSYEIPLTLKTKKETTGKKELDTLFDNTGDPVLALVTKIRSLDQNLNNAIPNWKPKGDSRVHTTFGFTASSGQLDARRPNVLNAGAHTEYSREFREIITAPVGRTFIEFDFRSFHVATMGYCANDKDYVRFSQIDPHSILGSYIDPSVIGQTISLKWSDKDIDIAAREFKKRCKEIEKKGGVNVRQELAKPTVLGNQLGLGAVKLQRQNRKFIKTIAEAEKMQELLVGLFPKVAKFKDAIREKAHLQQYLINEFGFIDYFFDVFSFEFNKRTNQWQKKHGDDSERVIAFPVQSTAFGKIQLDILECERLGYNEKYEFVVSIHDSLLFCVRVEHIDECLENVSRVMQAPCKMLINAATGAEGLAVGVEAKVGGTWANMKEVQIC
jgi:uracil-DNA glycosylase family 4